MWENMTREITRAYLFELKPGNSKPYDAMP